MHAAVRRYQVSDIDGLVKKVEDTTRQAAEWVRESAAHLIAGAPEVTAGEVRVRAER